MAIVNGTVRMQSTSTLTAKSNVVFAGAAKLKGTGKLSIFWLELKANSQLKIGNSIVQKLSGVALSVFSSLVADLVKAGPAYYRQVSLAGEAIYSVTLEGGGGEYMKTDQDFTLTAGDYLEMTVEITDESGKPKDVSASRFTWVMNGITKSNGAGIEVVDPEGGVIKITLTPEDTRTLFGKYTHQARMVDAHNHPTTIFRGVVKVDKGIA